MSEKKPSRRKPFVGPGPDNPGAVALRSIGEALYGPMWQAALSVAVQDLVPGKKFEPAVMRGWSIGQRAVSPWIWVAIREIAAKRKREVADAEKRVKQQIEKSPLAWPQYQDRLRQALNPTGEDDA